MLAQGFSAALDDFYPRPPRGGRRRRCALRSVLAVISIHALREEGDRADAGHRLSEGRFLSTPSARRATAAATAAAFAAMISIHALREEGDMGNKLLGGGEADFYPRPPRGGRLQLQQCPVELELISIHALREEGDRCVT